jgi:hypothetical protein
MTSMAEPNVHLTSFLLSTSRGAQELSPYPRAQSLNHIEVINQKMESGNTAFEVAISDTVVNCRLFTGVDRQ